MLFNKNADSRCAEARLLQNEKPHKLSWKLECGTHTISISVSCKTRCNITSHGEGSLNVLDGK